MKNPNIKFGFIFNTLVNSLIIVITLLIIVLINLNVIEKTNLKQEEAALRNDYDFLIKTQVESVISILDFYNTRVLSGELGAETAKKEAANIIRELRFGEDGYFWVDESNGENVVLLGWDTEGTNRLDSLDSNGFGYVRSFISNGMKPEGGYTDYYFPEPHHVDLILPKRGYTKYFAPFDWVIGTGNYVYHIDDLLANFAKEMRANNSDTIVAMAGATLVLLIISMMTSTRLANQRNRE